MNNLKTKRNADIRAREWARDRPRRPQGSRSLASKQFWQTSYGNWVRLPRPKQKQAEQSTQQQAAVGVSQSSERSASRRRRNKGRGCCGVATAERNRKLEKANQQHKRKVKALETKIKEQQRQIDDAANASHILSAQVKQQADVAIRHMEGATQHNNAPTHSFQRLSKAERAQQDYVSWASARTRRQVEASKLAKPARAEMATQTVSETVSESSYNMCEVAVQTEMEQRKVTSSRMVLYMPLQFIYYAFVVLHWMWQLCTTFDNAIWIVETFTLLWATYFQWLWRDTILFCVIIWAVLHMTQCMIDKRTRGLVHVKTGGCCDCESYN